ncbi:copia protein, partial [Tanacetum coccineum]
LGASVNIMPRSIFEHLKVANLKKIDMLVEMTDMSRKVPLGIVENTLVKINKFLFPSDFVIIDMLGEPNETMILERPFLTTIHAQIDVFKIEISLAIGEDRVLFDMDGSVCNNPSFTTGLVLLMAWMGQNADIKDGVLVKYVSHSNILVEKVYMANSIQEEESFNLLEIGDDLFSYESHACLQLDPCTQSWDNESIDTLDSVDNMQELEVEHEGMVRGPNLERITSRWHLCKPVWVFYDNECGKYYGMWPTCNPDLSFWCGYDAIYGKGENGMLEQCMCFRDHERQSVGVNRMIFANFFKLANEYNLRIRKKGYGLHDVWEQCKKYHTDTVYPWRDEGFEEQEKWESGIEKTDYKPPLVKIETFEIKRFSQQGNGIRVIEEDTTLLRIRGSRDGLLPLSFED